MTGDLFGAAQATSSKPTARNMRHPYQLVDGMTGALVGVYKALAIALRDCGARNAAIGDRRFYVRRPNGTRVTA